MKWSAQNYPCGHKDVLRLHQGSSISFRRGPNFANNTNPSATDLYIHSYYYNYYIIVAFVKIVTIWSQDEYGHKMKIFRFFSTSIRFYSNNCENVRRPGSSWGFGALLKGLTSRGSHTERETQGRDQNETSATSRTTRGNAHQMRTFYTIQLPELCCEGCVLV